MIVLNDNGRSYSPTAGALGDPPRRRCAPAAATSMLSLFEQLGMAYLGPVDGHDTVAVEAALRKARETGIPTVVHCVTTKGLGLSGRARPTRPIACTRSDRCRRRDAREPPNVDRRVRGRDARDRRVPAGRRGVVSAAMLGPTGLQAFASAYPVARLRRRHRRAARGDLGRRARDGRPAPGRVPSTRRSSTGPSTRC